MTQDSATRSRRRYDNTLRRERAAETSDRIIAAAAELVRESSIRDWAGLTMRSVAERAGVNERTVFRHFANERVLRDAVMRRLEEQAGVDLPNLRLDAVADAAGRIFRHVAAYPPEPRPALDPTLADAGRRQHEALLRAVGESAAAWSEDDRRLVAAILDVLWAISSYERLAVDWDLEPGQAITAVTWVIGLVQQAVSEGRGPTRRY